MSAQVKPVAWTNDIVPVELDEKEQEAIQARMKALDAILPKEHKARYKIELFFTRARSDTRPTPGVLSFWESGSKLHGGGDAKVYICPSKHLGRGTCEAFIPDCMNGSSFLICAACGGRWAGADVTGEIMARLTMQRWADVLLHYFRRLEHDADIYVKHAREDIRTVAMYEQAKQRGGEYLERVRGRRARHIYPLRNIIKDTSNGADLLGRFRAFLTA